ncbi:MAG: VanW family protein [Clostridia bacterium]|nr:VanW family protein [Clostridia bacterium]MBQ2433752.1 VanW family protein [Clostridia bacterium]MBQ5770728.1 VanW family protein [Clostridia bacterium]
MQRPPVQRRYAPQPARRRPPQRKQKKNTIKDWLSNPLIAILLVAAIVTTYVVIRRARTINNDYYLPGVYVNGVDMSAYQKEQGENMLIKWANGILDAEYRLTYGDKTWSVTPRALGASINTAEVLEKAWFFGHTGSASDRENMMMSLKYSPQELWTNFTYDESALRDFIERIAQEVYIAPQNADILLDADKPVILSQSKDGLALNTEELFDTLDRAMKDGSSKEIPLPVEEKPAAISSGDAQDGLQLIVSYQTSLEGSSSARRSNIRTALNNFNAFEVKIGEAVSFNEVVGARTTLRGYKEATVYYGATITEGVGGGICQASSTLYAAVLQAGMDVIERHSHTMVVAYCKASMDAAVSEDAQDDFVFVNNTDYNIYIYTDVTRDYATVNIYGRKPDYRIELYSTILQNNIKNTSIVTVPDETGVYAYYVDEYTLKKEGKLGRRSMLERIYYDWDTGLEVKREEVSNDYYDGERDIYWVGVHPIGTAQQ